MQSEIINIGLGFVEGIGLIISPCILPILPIVLSGSLTGNKQRPYGIIFGFVATFALFTFFSHVLVRYSKIDLNLIRPISYGLLLLFGLIMLSTFLTEKFSRWTQGLANTGANFSAANNPDGGFMSGILFGGLIALIWTPCAGPILAAVIIQAAVQETTLITFLVLLAFGIGAGIPMLAIALFGREIMSRLTFIKTHSELFRKLLGIIIILSVSYLAYNENLFASKPTNTTMLQDGILNSYQAPPIEGITQWINSPPLQINNLKGKVVLIDFWTYSCINCIRTLPYLKDWYKKYHDKGFIIIGVHSPEFAFERDFNNVKNAVQTNGILYPVALDNQFKTWQNYHNRYWPAHYLIDKNGYVVYQHFGEGDYDITESNIRYLLGIKESDNTSFSDSGEISAAETPETYLGYARSENFASPQTITQNQSASYTFPEELPENAWGLQGTWTIASDKVISGQADAAVKIHFNAKKVFIVMGNATHKPIQVKLLLNGEKIISEKGKDVMNSSITVNKNTLYEAIALPRTNSSILQLIASDPGLEIYTFTFG